MQPARAPQHPLPLLSSVAAGEMPLWGQLPPSSPRASLPRHLGKAAWLQGALVLNFHTTRFSAASECAGI